MHILFNSNIYKKNISNEDCLLTLQKDITNNISHIYKLEKLYYEEIENIENIESYINNIYLEIIKQNGLDQFKSVFMLNRSELKIEEDKLKNSLYIDINNLSKILIDDIGCKLINRELDGEGYIESYNRKIIDKGFVDILKKLLYKEHDEFLVNKRIEKIDFNKLEFDR